MPGTTGRADATWGAVSDVSDGVGGGRGAAGGGGQLTFSTELVARFWAKVDLGGPADCWLWLGYRKPSGYGYWSPNYRGRNWQTHRFAYAVTHGHEAEHEVCHTCDTHACCNPAHLYDGTHQQNMRDAVARGRRCRGENHPCSKLTPDAVRAIRRDHQRYRKGNLRALADRYGVSRTAVAAAVRGDTWGHVT